MANDLAQAMVGISAFGQETIQQILLPEYKSDHARLQGAAGLILSGLDLAQLSCLSQEIHTEELIALKCSLFNFCLC